MSSSLIYWHSYNVKGFQYLQPDINPFPWEKTVFFFCLLLGNDACCCKFMYNCNLKPSKVIRNLQVNSCKVSVLKWCSILSQLRQINGRHLSVINDDTYTKSIRKERTAIMAKQNRLQAFWFVFLLPIAVHSKWNLLPDLLYNQIFA